ncbi:MAG TPA: TerB family tellurite resistance protein [Azospirillaceae bacterium]|nr:TerB family tellurite resistance protein [Azospirillaceae bacterium]HRQ81108.1 TerB family tellurite resistance protein [Azospirillaceae bacterium]
MSIWGKLLGGAAGFALGGPLGALIGLAAGHAVDHFSQEYVREPEGDADATQSIAFTVGVIALSAKMAKADGVVKRTEIDTFRRLFHVPEDEMVNVGRVFDLARRDVAGFDAYARQIAELFDDRHAVLEELLDSLFLIAEADDHLHPQEVAFLRDVAAIFGFSPEEFERILASRPGHADDPEINPWAALGVTPGADEATVKAAYRKLLQEHHPDRLMAQGLPAEFIDVATEKTAAINAAYARIKALRRAAPAV